jgi:uncharacterized membrane protein
MKSRAELKSHARKIYGAHLTLLLLSASVIAAIGLVQSEITNMRTVFHEDLLSFHTFPLLGSVMDALLGANPQAILSNWYVELGMVVTAVLIALLGYGFVGLALRLSREDKQVSDLEVFAPFSSFAVFGRWLLFYLIFSVKVFLWTLLFIIPGIIALLRYAQAVFLMIDDPELKPNEAIKQSCEMMKGRLLEYFVLGLSFAGWIVLIILAGGIILAHDPNNFVLASIVSTAGMLLLRPYLELTFAGYYRELLAVRESKDSGNAEDGSAALESVHDNQNGS